MKKFWKIKNILISIYVEISKFWKKCIFRNFDQYICRAQVFSVYFFPYSRFINTQKFPVYKYTKIPGKNTNENFEILKNT